MKKFATGFALACIFAASVFAQDLSVEVISMNGNDDSSSSLDICIISFRVQNNTAVDIGLSLEVFPTYTAGSFSEMVAPAGTSFGLKNEVGFYGLPTGDGMQNEVRILGAICEEIESLELVPLCQEADGSYCNDAIVISATSVVVAYVQGGEAAGGRPVEVFSGPVGPLHGLIMVNNAASGATLMMFDIVHPEGESAKGTYLATPAICDAAGLNVGCDLAGKDGEIEFGRVRDDIQASLGARLSDADQGRLSFHWDLTTGAGFMRNIAGTANLPIRVEVMH